MKFPWWINAVIPILLQPLGFRFQEWDAQSSRIIWRITKWWDVHKLLLYALPEWTARSMVWPQFSETAQQGICCRPKRYWWPSLQLNKCSKVFFLEIPPVLSSITCALLPQTIAEVVGDWYFDRGMAKEVDCPYPCDSTCDDLIPSNQVLEMTETILLKAQQTMCEMQTMYWW